MVKNYHLSTNHKPNDVPLVYLIGGLTMKTSMVTILAIIFLSTVNQHVVNADPQTDVGTYLLTVVKENGQDVLYRINTKTGQVWNYLERFILSSDRIAKNDQERSRVDKVIQSAKSMGKNVFTQPYWELTSEESS